MRKIFIILLSGILIVSQISCSGASLIKSSSYSEVFLADEDYDPTSYAYGVSSTPAVVTPEGLYFVAGSYLFFMNKETKEVHPLCFKTECLHHEEEAAYKIAECNAYLGTPPGVLKHFLGYYKGKLYVSSIDSTTRKLALIEMDPDGSERKTILKDLSSLGVQQIYLHRGVLYYYTNKYDSEGKLSASMYGISLVSDNSDPVLLYETSDGKTSIDALLPYKNIVYMVVFNETEDDDGNIDAKQWIEKYHIDNGKIDRIELEGVFYPCSIYREKVLIRKALEYYEYEPSKNKISQSNSGVAVFQTSHPGWNCYGEATLDDISFVTCLDLEETGDFIYDLFVIDDQGNELCRLENEAWGIS